MTPPKRLLPNPWECSEEGCGFTVAIPAENPDKALDEIREHKASHVQPELPAAKQPPAGEPKGDDMAIALTALLQSSIQTQQAVNAMTENVGALTQQIGALNQMILDARAQAATQQQAPVQTAEGLQGYPGDGHQGYMVPPTAPQPLRGGFGMPEAIQLLNAWKQMNAGPESGLSGITATLNGLNPIIEFLERLRLSGMQEVSDMFKTTVRGGIPPEQAADGIGEAIRSRQERLKQTTAQPPTPGQPS